MGMCFPVYRWLKDDIHDANSCYVPNATNWNELFNVGSLEDGWGCNIESLAYSVYGVV